MEEKSKATNIEEFIAKIRTEIASLFPGGGFEAFLRELSEVRPSVHFDRQEARDYLDTCLFSFGAREQEMKAYNDVHLSRYLTILEQLKGFPRDIKVLELGAFPYGLTVLLKKYLFEDITLTNFDYKKSVAEREIVEIGRRRASPLKFEQYNFNAEAGPWPFEEGSFGLVICTELLEHLLFDPMHVFSEANRALTMGGSFFISTPNTCSYKNQIKIQRGLAPSLAPHFRLPKRCESGYGRHNREFTLQAVADLFSSSGFKIDFTNTSNSYPADLSGLSPAECLAFRLLAEGRDTHFDTIYGLGVKSGKVIDRFPVSSELYLPGEKLI